MNEEYQRIKHGVGQNDFHFVWCPKYRIPVFKIPQQRKVCEGALKLICYQRGYKIHELRVMEDHIHLFLRIPPYVSVSEAFQNLKGISARILFRRSSWLRKRFPSRRLWSPGKFFRSVGAVTAQVIENYITKSSKDWRKY